MTARRAAVVGAVTAAAVAVAAPAWAYYALTSTTAHRTVTAATLAAPGAPTATAAATSVTLSWPAAAGLPEPARYVVTRDGATVCTVAATSCEDTGVAPGTTYAYAVAAALPGTAWRSAAAAVGVTTPHVFAVTAANGSPLRAQVAGTAFDVRVTALKGPQLTADPAYAGDRDVTFAGAAAAPDGTSPSAAGGSFGTARRLAFAGGSATVPVTLVAKATAVTLTATAGTTTGSSATFAVGAGTPSRLAFTSTTGLPAGTSCLTGCSVGGLGSSPTVTSKVSATDSLGNTVTDLGTARTFTVAKTGGGTLSGASLTIPATGAAESATAFTFTAGSANYTATITAPATGGLAAVQMTLAKN